MPTFGNRARVSTATTGTGTITLGSPVTGLQSFAAAGVIDGNLVRYVIEDGTAWEIGTGVYTASGTTLERGPTQSSIGGAAITLSGSAEVFLSVAAEDMAQLTDVQEFTTPGTTTWIKPAGAVYIHVVMHGGGGGGGSGYIRGSTSSAQASGGGGGGAGGRVEFLFPAFDIGTTVSLTVGAGGTGGATRTTAGNGQPGIAGGASSFDVIVARGGSFGGLGSTTSAGAGVGGGGTTCLISGSSVYSGNATTGTASTASNASRGGLAGGGGAGGPGNAVNVTTARIGAEGGFGGAVALSSITNTTGGGGSGGPSTGGNGADGPDAPDIYFGGSGGGSGGVSTFANIVGNGGNGGFPGGGGGGGSYGQLDAGGINGGGGNGGGGAIRITTFF